ncbi:hypothetical protein F4821DRAFT_32588 [Hypoxylon rubiginosum]|uniref:Uncharacterized protein n=1 Tax=Hypoxylon rubiginosum TaxID=110542 RepID=A0ACC0CLG0_9PEZI|nr:hypothetical protein F4821DRAFT_32588 [Hypoxylon rubiginosum]
MGSINGNSSSDGTLYFAYGSNLSTTQMRDRCPKSTPVALARLKGWKWIINQRGVANIVPDPPRSPSKWPTLPFDPLPLLELCGNTRRRDEDDNVVYGLLYRLHPHDEEALDACEGVPWVYERQFLDVVQLPAPGADAKTQKTQKTQKTAENTVKVLVYVDRNDTHTGPPRTEYVGRMNRAVEEAVAEWGLPKEYANSVIRPCIPAAESNKSKKSKK